MSYSIDNEQFPMVRSVALADRLPISFQGVRRIREWQDKLRGTVRDFGAAPIIRLEGEVNGRHAAVVYNTDSGRYREVFRSTYLPKPKPHNYSVAIICKSLGYNLREATETKIRYFREQGEDIRNGAKGPRRRK